MALLSYIPYFGLTYAVYKMPHIGARLKMTRRIAVFGLAVVFLVLLAIFLFAGFSLFLDRGPHTVAQEISFSQLVNDVEAGRIHDVLIRGSDIYGTYNDGHRFQTYAPTDPMLVQRIYNKGVSITAQP